MFGHIWSLPYLNILYKPGIYYTRAGYNYCSGIGSFPVYKIVIISNTLLSV